MSSSYWLVYDDNRLDGPYSDLLKCREYAVTDAADLNCLIQIHHGSEADCNWGNESTLIEEW